VEQLFTLPPEAFNPPPDVHSTVIRMTMASRVEELQIQEGPFIALLKLAFAQKRKTLANNLKGTYSDASIKAGLKAAGLRPDVRAEAVPLEKMAALSRSLQPA
jgi:16S rRNA (adenine1518-N6/adenine1519-N6)-dimethyltransferase